MATANPYGVERRHTPDRRSGLSRVSGAVRPTAFSAIDYIAMTLLIVGGINWGLVGLFNVDLVAELFGVMTPMSRVVYALVGLAALWSIYTTMKMASDKHTHR